METIALSQLVACAPSTNGPEGGLLKGVGTAKRRVSQHLWEELIRHVGWGTVACHHH